MRRRRDLGRPLRSARAALRRAVGRSRARPAARAGARSTRPTRRPWFTKGCACTRPASRWCAARSRNAMTAAVAASGDKRVELTVVRRGEHDHLVRAGNAVADDRVQVRHDAHLPARRVGRAARRCARPRAASRLVALAERARRPAAFPSRRSPPAGTPRAGSRVRARRSRCAPVSSSVRSSCTLVRLGGSVGA